MNTYYILHIAYIYIYLNEAYSLEGRVQPRDSRESRDCAQAKHMSGEALSIEAHESSLTEIQ